MVLVQCSFRGAQLGSELCHAAFHASKLIITSCEVPKILLRSYVSLVVRGCDVVMKSAVFTAVPSQSMNRIPASASYATAKVRNNTLVNTIVI